MAQVHKFADEALHVYRGITELFAPDIIPSQAGEEFVVVRVIDDRHAAFLIGSSAQLGEELGAQQVHRLLHFVCERSIFARFKADLKGADRLAAESFVRVHTQRGPAYIVADVLHLIHLAHIPKKRCLAGDLFVRSEIDADTVFGIVDAVLVSVIEMDRFCALVIAEFPLFVLQAREKMAGGIEVEEKHPLDLVVVLNAADPVGFLGLSFFGKNLEVSQIGPVWGGLNQVIGSEDFVHEEFGMSCL